MPAPESAKAPASKPDRHAQSAAAAASAGRGESDQEFRAAHNCGEQDPGKRRHWRHADEVPGADAAPKGPLEAITLYNRLLTEYPNTRIATRSSIRWRERTTNSAAPKRPWKPWSVLIRANPNSVHFDEVQFRRGEYFFTRRKFRDAENAYSAITNLGARSSYYELALYKLGWTFYKQELYEEALQQVHGAARLQGVDRLQLRSEARGRGRTPRRRYLSRQSA